MVAEQTMWQGRTHASTRARKPPSRRGWSRPLRIVERGSGTSPPRPSRSMGANAHARRRRRRRRLRAPPLRRCALRELRAGRRLSEGQEDAARRQSTPDMHLGVAGVLGVQFDLELADSGFGYQKRLCLLTVARTVGDDGDPVRLGPPVVLKALGQADLSRELGHCGGAPTRRNAAPATTTGTRMRSVPPVVLAGCGSTPTLRVA